MVAIVFFLGAMNLLLGFMAAVALAQSPRWVVVCRQAAIAAAHRRQLRQLRPPEPPSEPPSEPPPTATTAAQAVVELPGEWISALEREAVVATNFVEASVHVLRLEIGRYRERIVSIDDQLRGLESVDAATLEAIAAEITEVNEEWMAKQAEAVEHLSSRRGTLGEFEQAGQELESVLLEQRAQIETTICNLKLLDIAANIDESRKRLTREVLRLVDLAHLLRDRMAQSLLAIMVAEKKVSAMEERFQHDAGTGLLNRFGLEALLEKWWTDDPGRKRMASCILVDIDRAARINERLGPRLADDVLSGVGKCLERMVRSNRGFDRVSRLSGQTYLIFMGDAGPRNAFSAAERMRQTFKVTTFEVGTEPVQLTCSIGVVEVGKRDTSAWLIERLQQAVKMAKQSGRDQTALDEGSGPQSSPGPAFQIKPLTVQV